MLAGFQIGAFTGWVVGYTTVYSNLESAAEKAGREGVSIMEMQVVPIAPDTIFCMATGAAIGLIAGWVASILKVKTSENSVPTAAASRTRSAANILKPKTSEDEKQSWWLGK